MRWGLQGGAEFWDLIYLNEDLIYLNEDLIYLNEQEKACGRHRDTGAPPDGVTETPPLPGTPVLPTAG